VLGGGGPHILQPLHLYGAERVHLGAGTREEPDEVQVELVLGTQLGRIDGERDLVLLGNVGPGHVPREGPDPVGAPRVFHPRHGEARESEAVDEAGAAAAHLEVADRHVFLVERPHLGRPRAGVVEPAIARLRARAARAVAGVAGVQAILDDTMKRVGRDAGGQAARAHHEAKGDEDAAHGARGQDQTSRVFRADALITVSI
jgi:hypothetical protein